MAFPCITQKGNERSLAFPTQRSHEFIMPVNYFENGLSGGLNYASIVIIDQWSRIYNPLDLLVTAKTFVIVIGLSLELRDLLGVFVASALRADVIALFLYRYVKLQLNTLQSDKEMTTKCVKHSSHCLLSEVTAICIFYSSGFIEFIIRCIVNYSKNIHNIYYSKLW